jgi:hypothetical protein
MPKVIPNTSLDKSKIECAGVPTGAKMLVGEDRNDAKIWVDTISKNPLTTNFQKLADQGSDGA